jgi:5-methylcytosine-specific restriction endonuclease McrA
VSVDCAAVPRGKPDLSNTAVRIFLQDFGAAYDDERGLPRYVKSKHFDEIQSFFGGRCCYCGVDLDGKGVQDHLVPLNQTGLGLHAWGNIVPSCAQCNAFKQGRPWHEVVAARAGGAAAARYKRITEFVSHYQYAPPYDLASATADLYAETGEVAMALIRTKIRRTKEAT